jgi:hypothetical protein
MDSATRRIPPSEWDLWKTTVLDLAADNTIKNVVSIMEDNHGFRARYAALRSSALDANDKLPQPFTIRDTA